MSCQRRVRAFQCLRTARRIWRGPRPAATAQGPQPAAPPRRAGGIPLSHREAMLREGAEGRGSKPACASLDASKSCRLRRPAPSGAAAQGD